MSYSILIVNAEYYMDITDNLEKSAVDYLREKNCNYKIIKSPGVFEIPVIISKNIEKYDGIVALGCVIKGETPHFDYISKSSIDALMYLSIKYKKPIGNGIITCFNKKQAKDRCKLNDKKNKGKEAAKAAIRVLEDG